MTANEVGARTVEEEAFRAGHHNHLFVHKRTFLAGQSLRSGQETKDALQHRLKD